MALGLCGHGLFGHGLFGHGLCGSGHGPVVGLQTREQTFVKRFVTFTSLITLSFTMYF